MNSDHDTGPPSGRDDRTAGLTPSVAELKRLIGPSPTPRMLTPYEIELLRKAVQETAKVAGEVFAGKTVAGDQDETSR